VFDWLSLTSFNWPSAVKSWLAQQAFQGSAQLRSFPSCGGLMIAQYPIFIGEDPKTSQSPAKESTISFWGV
jgi:hypothetical protein